METLTMQLKVSILEVEDGPNPTLSKPSLLHPSLKITVFSKVLHHHFSMTLQGNQFGQIEGILAISNRLLF